MAWMNMRIGNVTPEERLLRVIESGGEGKARFTFWNLRTWPALFGRSRAQAGPRWGALRGWANEAFSLTRINQGLIVLLVGSVAGLVYDMQRVQPSVDALIIQATASKSLATEEPPLPAEKPLDEYLKEAETRDLFALALPKGAPGAKGASTDPDAPDEPAEPPPPTPLEILQKKAEGLKLVGISLGEPLIAMIEDKTNGKTFFLREGESFLEMKVQRISKKTVVLRYQEAQYELF